MSETATSMAILDRVGIFKMRPFAWSLEKSTSSKSVAVAVSLQVLAQYQGGEWASWEDYEPVQTRGWWYVIGKGGQVNQSAVDQLAKSLGWNGDLRAIRNNLPPDVVVQITVKENVFNNKTTYKPSWMNPEDYSPEFGASDDDVANLSAQFGSLLRAAASGVAKGDRKFPAPRPGPVETAQPGMPPVAVAAGGESVPDDEVPF